MLLVLGAGQAQAQGGWGGPDPQRREAILRQQAEAMARLNGRQRRDYFEARRELERRHSAQRLDQLSQLERCVERAGGASAIERCQRSIQEQRLAQRRQEMDELAALQRRYGLPGWADGRGGFTRPAPRPQGPSSYGRPPYGGQPYGGQPYGGQPYGQQPYGGFGQPYGAQPGGSNWLGEVLQSLFF
jgi:hypothetical protein